MPYLNFVLYVLIKNSTNLGLFVSCFVISMKEFLNIINVTSFLFKMYAVFHHPVLD